MSQSTIFFCHVGTEPALSGELVCLVQAHNSVLPVKIKSLTESLLCYFCKINRGSYTHGHFAELNKFHMK